MTNAYKVALVTGASSGIGLFTSIELCKAGWKVFGTTRTEDRKNIIRNYAQNEGCHIEPLTMDLENSLSIQSAVDHILKNEGRIDLLVNNAGSGLGGFLFDLPMIDIEKQINISFLGTLRVTKAVLPSMIRSKSGKIIVISSISGIVPIPGVGTYGASKFALEGQFEALRHELRDFGVEIALIEPGVYQTDIYTRNKFRSKNSFNPQSPFYERTLKMEKFAAEEVKRGHHPREVARVVTKLANGKIKSLRHPVGLDAKMEYFIKKIFPQRIYESIIYSLSLGKALKMDGDKRHFKATHQP